MTKMCKNKAAVFVLLCLLFLGSSAKAKAEQKTQVQKVSAEVLLRADSSASRFYKDGQLLRVMYVNSPEGLRARAKPELNSARICRLRHRLVVKPVATAQTDEIDGIKAPWVKILLPRTEWKGTAPEYGYVFGGYLAEEPPPFSEDSISIEDFITQCDWATDSSSTAFYENHYYLFCAFDSEWHDGKWEWNAKNKMLTVYANSPFDDSVETLMYSIKICDEETIEIINSAHSSATVLKSKASIQESLRFYNRNTNSWQPSLAKAENFNYQNLYFKGGTFIIEELKKLNALDENISFLIESGIYSESYQQKFDDYWNPIIAEQQRQQD